MVVGTDDGRRRASPVVIDPSVVRTRGRSREALSSPLE